MKELMLDKRDAALMLLTEVAKLKRYCISTHVTLNVPANLLARIDLVLDFPDEPGEQTCPDR